MMWMWNFHQAGIGFLLSWIRKKTGPFMDHGPSVMLAMTGNMSCDEYLLNTLYL